MVIDMSSGATVLETISLFLSPFWVAYPVALVCAVGRMVGQVTSSGEHCCGMNNCKVMLPVSAPLGANEEGVAIGGPAMTTGTYFRCHRNARDVRRKEPQIEGAGPG